MRPWGGQAYELLLKVIGPHSQSTQNGGGTTRGHSETLDPHLPALIDPKAIYIFPLNRKQGKGLDLLLSLSTAVHLLPCVLGWMGVVRSWVGS